jgi:N-acetylmuramoyl-L-alanine amidase
MALAASTAAAAPLVAIDPGHGGGDPGAIGTLPPGTQTGLPERLDADGRTRIYEKDVTLDIGLRLDAWLRERGYPTVMTRTTDAAGGDVPFTTVGADLKARVDIANAAGARIFVSIHENSLSATATGTETYRFYYSGASAKALADLIHEQVLAALGLPDRGVKTAGFYVLKNTRMPAVLVEGAFLSNPAEALLLADPATRQRVAEAIGAGVVRYTDLGYDALYVPTQALPLKYQVNVGAFRRLADARARYRALRRLGFTAQIRSEYHARARRNLFYVVAGRFPLLPDARDLRDRLRAAKMPANVGPVRAKSRVLPAQAPR